MPRFRVIVAMTTYADTYVEAKDADDAWEIARAMDGAEFEEIAGEGGWSLEVFDT